MEKKIQVSCDVSSILKICCKNSNDYPIETLLSFPVVVHLSLRNDKRARSAGLIEAYADGLPYCLVEAVLLMLPLHDTAVRLSLSWVNCL